MKKIIIQFTQNGSYIDSAWEGKFQAYKGEQKAVSPSLAMRLVTDHLATTVLDKQGNPLMVDY